MEGEAQEVPILRDLGFSNVELLGEGAFGTVFSCDHSDGRRVAAKICFGPANRETLAREEAVMRALPSHPNIMPVLGTFKNPICSVLVIPMACGGDTLALMRERNNAPMTEPHARLLFVQLLRALSVMHQAGYVHRDIKCENLLLADTTRHQLILADFGFAAAYRPGHRTLTETWGSVHYSSPEICARIPYVGPEVDVWSAGVVLYAWVTGRLPFGGSTEGEISERVVKACYSQPMHTSPELNSLFRAIFTPKAHDRITIPSILGHHWMLAVPEAPRPFTYVRPRSVSIVNVESSEAKSATPVLPSERLPHAPDAPLASSKRQKSPQEESAEQKKAPGPLDRVTQFFKSSFLPQRAQSSTPPAVPAAVTSSDCITVPPATIRATPLILPSLAMKTPPTSPPADGVQQKHV